MRRKRKPLPAPRRTFAIAAVLLFAVAAVALQSSRLLASAHPYVTWLGAWTIATFLFYGFDKFQARREGGRVPEIVLHGMVLAGGFIGGFLGLLMVRHKTQHGSFVLVPVLSALLHAGLMWWLGVV
ncbi:MAG: DUF1294 domain-containing protein [Chloroflexaceae bacterium]|nr:DUF1294 domain-containing protein [Chloroflexaceae bacterium]